MLYQLQAITSPPRLLLSDLVNQLYSGNGFFTTLMTMIGFALCLCSPASVVE